VCIYIYACGYIFTFNFISPTSSTVQKAEYIEKERHLDRSGYRRSPLSVPTVYPMTTAVPSCGVFQPSSLSLSLSLSL
jgi:hypothetical protein